MGRRSLSRATFSLELWKLEQLNSKNVKEVPNGFPALSFRALNTFPVPHLISFSVPCWTLLLVKRPIQTIIFRANPFAALRFIIGDSGASLKVHAQKTTLVCSRATDSLWHGMAPSDVHAFTGTVYVAWNAFSLFWLVHQLCLFLVQFVLATVIPSLVVPLNWITAMCFAWGHPRRVPESCS